MDWLVVMRSILEPYPLCLVVTLITLDVNRITATLCVPVGNTVTLASILHIVKVRTHVECLINVRLDSQLVCLSFAKRHVENREVGLVHALNILVDCGRREAPVIVLRRNKPKTVVIVDISSFLPVLLVPFGATV